MTYFKDGIFMTSLLIRQGASQCFERRQLLSMSGYVQMEMRSVVQNAIKFMRKDGRDVISVQDVQMAAVHLGHGELAIAPSPKSLGSAQEGYLSLVELTKICGGKLAKHIDEGYLTGGWLLRQDKICKNTNSIRRLKKQELNQCVNKVRGRFNIALYSQYNRFTIEETTCLLAYHKLFQKNKLSKFQGVYGDFDKLFEPFLEILCIHHNEASLKFLVQLLPLVSKATVRSNLRLILKILLLYEGILASKVGELIALFYFLFREMQPDLQKILEGQRQSSSFVLKSIVFEHKTGIRNACHQLGRIMNEAVEKVGTSRVQNEFLRTLCRKGEEVEELWRQEVYLPIWVPSQWFEKDCYLVGLYDETN